jgi:cation diffusion facilitator family transporter
MATGSQKVVYAALIGNLLIALTKFVAAGITGSSAMLSEGVHSVVDTGNEALLLYGMHRARKPPDDRFPFGHGKEIYFWSFVVALLVFALGAGISFYEGVRHLRHPAVLENPVINYWVLGLALVFESGSWAVAFKEFRASKGPRGYIEAVQRGKDPTTFTVLFEDTAALLGLLVALGGVALGAATGNPLYDGAASIVIGLILAVTAFWLALETKGLLIGESANREVVDGIRELIRRIPQVDRVNEILTMHMGPDFILANISLHVARDVERAQVHQIFEDIDRGIKQRYPKVRRVFIESEIIPDGATSQAASAVHTQRDSFAGGRGR